MLLHAAILYNTRFLLSSINCSWTASYGRTLSLRKQKPSCHIEKLCLFADTFKDLHLLTWNTSRRIVEWIEGAGRTKYLALNFLSPHIHFRAKFYKPVGQGFLLKRCEKATWVCRPIVATIRGNQWARARLRKGNCFWIDNWRPNLRDNKLRRQKKAYPCRRPNDMYKGYRYQAPQVLHRTRQLSFRHDHGDAAAGRHRHVIPNYAPKMHFEGGAPPAYA